MAKQIRYFEVNRKHFEEFDWVKEDVDIALKIFQIINVETLKNTIRFWYNKEE